MSKASHKPFRTEAVQLTGKCSGKWAQKFLQKFIHNSKNLSGPQSGNKCQYTDHLREKSHG